MDHEYHGGCRAAACPHRHRHKTRLPWLCAHWCRAVGHCMVGAKCMFTHATLPVIEATDCPDYLDGRQGCPPALHCRMRHSPAVMAELRAAVEERRASTVRACAAWMAGHCAAGPACPHLHSQNRADPLAGKYSWLAGCVEVPGQAVGHRGGKRSLAPGASPAAAAGPSWRAPHAPTYPPPPLPPPAAPPRGWSFARPAPAPPAGPPALALVVWDAQSAPLPVHAPSGVLDGLTVTQHVHTALAAAHLPPPTAVLVAVGPSGLSPFVAGQLPMIGAQAVGGDELRARLHAAARACSVMVVAAGYAVDAWTRQLRGVGVERFAFARTPASPLVGPAPFSPPPPTVSPPMASLHLTPPLGPSPVAAALAPLPKLPMASCLSATAAPFQPGGGAHTTVPSPSAACSATSDAPLPALWSLALWPVGGSAAGSGGSDSDADSAGDCGGSDGGRDSGAVGEAGDARYWLPALLEEAL
jgi:hypothetical protein